MAKKSIFAKDDRRMRPTTKYGKSKKEKLTPNRLVVRIVTLLIIAILAANVMLAVVFNHDSKTFFLLSGLISLGGLATSWFMYFWFGKKYDEE